MKGLVYTFAYGDDYFLNLADAMFATVRSTGCTYDMVVLTDEEGAKHNFQNCVPVVVNRSRPFLWKCAITPDLYEHVVYSDTDVVWAQSPETLYSPDCVVTAGHPSVLGESLLHSAFMTDAERRMSKESGISACNTGIVSMSGEVAKKFLPEWDAFWRECCDKNTLPDLWCGAAPDNQLWDEAAFHAMKIRGMVKADVAMWPQTILPVEMGRLKDSRQSFSPSKTIAVHFCGQVKRGDTRDLIKKWVEAGTKMIAVSSEEARAIGVDVARRADSRKQREQQSRHDDLAEIKQSLATIAKGMETIISLVSELKK